MGAVSAAPITLPLALAEVDRALGEAAVLRAKLASLRGEVDNVYALLRQANTHNAALSIEMAQAHAEREQLRDSVQATTVLVEELMGDRAALRRRVEELANQADDLRAASAYQRQ